MKLDNIDIAYGFGVRMMLLTFNTRNYIGDGCGETSDCGLSDYGLKVIDRMNQIGMLIDASHCGDMTTLEAIEASKDPIVINHSGARSLSPKIKRLKTDECLKALSEKDGLIGVYAVPNFLNANKRQGINDVLDHVGYITKLIGTDHVGIGTDIMFKDHVAFHKEVMMKTSSFADIGVDIQADYMEGIESPEEFPNIIRGLISRGYSDEEISKMIGGNAVRIFKTVLSRKGHYIPQYISS
jgi:membrane dipeptidase